MSKQKTTRETEVIYNKIAITHGILEKTKDNKVKWRPADFAELKNIAAAKGMDVTNKTNKTELVDFFIK